MREPIRLPKITKYRVMVITGGTSVCTQMRIKRWISLVQMLFSATQ